MVSVVSPALEKKEKQEDVLEMEVVGLRGSETDLAN
jgi:hypothetical protein